MKLDQLIKLIENSLRRGDETATVDIFDGQFLHITTRDPGLYAQLHSSITHHEDLFPKGTYSFEINGDRYHINHKINSLQLAMVTE